MSIKEKLINSSEKEYGNDYKKIVLEQYKLFVEMADRISSRRQSANSFFLSINTVLITVIGYSVIKPTEVLPVSLNIVAAIAGMILCYTWFRIIKSYEDLNTAKFEVIHEIEQLLPLSPYDAEWEAVGRGNNPKLYLPFTHVEMTIPWIFFSLHALSLLLKAMFLFIN